MAGVSECRDDHAIVPEGFLLPAQRVRLGSFAKANGMDQPINLVKLVVEALPGWRTTSAGNVLVEDKSGEGGGRTYRVSATGANPPQVALHVRSEQAAADAISETRMACAARLFAKAGLSPSRLAESHDWFIERWEGLGEPNITAERSRELGELVARIHAIPIDWFDPWREMLCKRFSDLRNVPRGSHVWFWTARKEFLDELTDECRRQVLDANFFAPRSIAAARVVTAHADVHPGNMLQTEMGIRVLDFEYSCVTYAVQDLCQLIYTCFHLDTAMKRGFVHAYLSASNLPATEQDVEATLFDCELAVLGSHLGPLDLWSARDEPKRWLEKFDMYRTFVQDARGSAGLRQHILAKGIQRYVRELRPLCVVGSPVVMCACGYAANERFVACQDGTICMEAMRSLVLGVDVGNVVLVNRNDTDRRLVFRLCHAARPPLAGAMSPAIRIRSPRLSTNGSAKPHAACAVPASPSVEAALPFRLILDSHPGQGVVAAASPAQTSAGEQRTVAFKLGPAEQAISVVFNGSFILCQQTGLAMHVGDPQKEIEAKLDTDLYEAIERGDVAAMQELIAQVSNINQPREHEPFGHCAAREGHLTALEVLLAHGYLVNSTASYGGSALVEAATYGHVDCVRRLLCVPGIDLRLTDDGRTALEWARDPSQHVEPSPSHAEIAQLLEAAERGLLPIKIA
eukprot:TRINITY_DN28924_c0_g1_i3.p1 TRINITY_DN28924_c0_g1~~TRINITY_DN28924_c0_g1_i3.p1  ORF type:complete len:705 (+),score=84.82 TRINITY_DN28924_c0_g1_i3:58-2115(+)